MICRRSDLLSVFLLASSLVLVIYASQSSKVIRNKASIYTIGIEVYFDAECTRPCEQIDWGVLYAGDSKTQLLYIKNTGNACCNLTMVTANWDPPEASSYIILEWNYTGQTLNPSDVLPVTFTLEVSQQITGISYFKFDIIITANA
jgi:hypothetical protein